MILKYPRLRLSDSVVLARRRCGFREWHQDDRHRDAADLAAHVEQGPASHPTAGGRPPPGLGANAHPLARRRPEQLDRQVRIGIRHHMLQWPRDAMGPVRRTEHRRQRPGARDDRMMEAKPGDVIAGASIASMNHGLPWAALRVRTGNRVGSAGSQAWSANPGSSTARSRDSVTLTVAHGNSASIGHSVLSMTLTRPPSVTTLSCVRRFAIGVGRRNHAVTETAVPHFRCADMASTSAVSRLTTAPPCKPAKGPAASAEGRQ